MTPEEHWKHFEKSWLALKSYTYLGKATPFLDTGVEREMMPLRHDMRNSTGGDHGGAAVHPRRRSRTGATTSASPRR